MMHVGSDAGIDFAMDGLTMIGGGQNNFFLLIPLCVCCPAVFFKKALKPADG